MLLSSIASFQLHQLLISLDKLLASEINGTNNSNNNQQQNCWQEQIFYKLYQINDQQQTYFSYNS